jgi:hypothetical protein
MRAVPEMMRSLLKSRPPEGSGSADLQENLVHICMCVYTYIYIHTHKDI